MFPIHAAGVFMHQPRELPLRQAKHAGYVSIRFHGADQAWSLREKGFTAFDQ